MKRFVKASMVLATLALLLSSCNCYNRMLKKVDRVKITSTPEVLTLKGSNVTADLKVEFPPKYFDEMAVLKITPVLVYEGGEIAGTPKFVQGSSVKDNYTVISWKEGGSYTQTVTFPYTPDARLATLELRIDSKCANKCKKKFKEFVPFAAVPAAQGVSTVQLLADNLAYLSLMDHNYKRVVTETETADIMFLINKADVRKNQLTTEQLKAFEDFVKEYSNKDRAKLGNVFANGYASPDGPVKFNDELSKKRGENAKDAVSEQLKDLNLNYDVAAYGEDWKGFKELVEASDIQDKDLILQVLAMYSNPVQRDQEIKNMSSVFEVLAEEILPQLRRTVMVANVDIEGLTDAELKAAVNGGKLNDLNEQQMLYVATLFEDGATKVKIYQAAANKFQSANAYNNLGVALAQNGQLADAKRAFSQAAAKSSDPAITSNQGAVALAEGNVAEAKKLLSALNTPDANANKGLVALAEGNYTEAVKTLKGYNLAVAEVLNGNLAKASSALAGDNSADADYLKAVIAMRQGDSNAAIANLKSACAKDPSLKEQAKTDVEFAKIFGSAEFLAL